MDNRFIRAEEVAAELDVSKPYAYKLIRQLNEELKAKGFLTIAGRVNRQYFNERFYGTERTDADASLADHTAACGRNPTGGMFFSEPLDLFRLSEYNYNGFLYRDLRGVCYEWIYYSPGSCLKMGNFSPTSSDSV